MANTPFHAVVEALWGSLGLGQPRLDASSKATLTIDGSVISLGMTADEQHILVTATVGTIAAEPNEAAAQFRQLLRDSAALALTTRAALRLDGDVRAGAKDRVLAEALVPCRSDALQPLKQALEEVLSLIDVHRPSLSGSRSQSRAQSPFAPSGLDGTLIFRP